MVPLVSWSMPYLTPDKDLPNHPLNSLCLYSLVSWCRWRRYTQGRVVSQRAASGVRDPRSPSRNVPSLFSLFQHSAMSSTRRQAMTAATVYTVHRGPIVAGKYRFLPNGLQRLTPISDLGDSDLARGRHVNQTKHRMGLCTTLVSG